MFFFIVCIKLENNIFFLAFCEEYGPEKYMKNREGAQWSASPLFVCLSCGLKLHLDAILACLDDIDAMRRHRDGV